MLAPFFFFFVQQNNSSSSSGIAGSGSIVRVDPSERTIKRCKENDDRCVRCSGGRVSECVFVASDSWSESGNDQAGILVYVVNEMMRAQGDNSSEIRQESLYESRPS